MKTRAFFIMSLLLASQLQAQSIAGDWHGMLEVPGAKLRLVFHIKAEADGFTATMDSPDQGALGLPVKEVEFKNPELVLRLPNFLIEYKGNYDASGDAIKGTFFQGNGKFPLDLQRTEMEKQVLRRPQHPEPPFPYYTEDVVYDNPAAGIKLAGTLSLPSKEGKFPVIILISGSGPQNRDEELLGHKPFLVIADHLTRQGIGVLRFDDRGVGKSTGTFGTATSEDFASDVMAGINYLKTRPEVLKEKIGLVGHSEGGLIAPMVAAKMPKDVAFIVLLAGPGVPGDAVVLRQAILIGRAEGQSDSLLQVNNQFMEKAFARIRKGGEVETIKSELREETKEMIRAEGQIPEEQLDQQAEQQLNSITGPWFRFFLTYDPAPTLSKVKCPVLALNGEKDLQVEPAQNLPPIDAALKKGGNKNYTVKILPGLNHLFQKTETGRLSEYGTLEETFSPIALNEISSWIKKR